MSLDYLGRVILFTGLFMSCSCDRSDPTQAAPAVSTTATFPNGDLSGGDDLVKQAEELLVKNRREEAVNLLRRLPSMEFQHALIGLLESWVEKDPLAVFHLISEVEEDGQRMLFFDQAIGGLLRKRTSIDSLRTMIKEGSKGNEKLALEVILVERLKVCLDMNQGGWTVSDIEYAFEQVPFGRYRNMALKHVVSTIFKNGPSKALERFADEFTDPYEKRAVSDGMSDYLSANPAIEEVKLLLGSDDPIFRSWGVKGLFMSVDRNTFPSTPIDEALGMIPSEFEDDLEIKKAFLSNWALARPDQMKTYFSTLENPLDFPEILNTVARRISRDNPEEAANWIEGFNSPIGVEAVTNSWMSVDSIRASEWVASLPEGEVRDAGAIAIANRMLSEQRSEEAAAWIDAVSDDKMREELEVRINTEKVAVEVEMID